MAGEARGYSWAPFAPGHQLSTKHGADSARVLRPIVDELIGRLVEAAPWTAAPVFRPTVEAWAHVEAQCVRYRAWFDEHGIGEGDEDKPGSLGRWDKAEGRAASLRAELGLSPASLTRLLSGLSSIDAPAAASGLEALRAAGAELRQAAEQPAVTVSSSSPVEVAEDGEHGTHDGGGRSDGAESHAPKRGRRLDEPSRAAR